MYIKSQKTVIAKLQELGIEFHVTFSFEIGYDRSG